MKTDEEILKILSEIIENEKSREDSLFKREEIHLLINITQRIVMRIYRTKRESKN